MKRAKTALPTKFIGVTERKKNTSARDARELFPLALKMLWHGRKILFGVLNTAWIHAGIGTPVVGNIVGDVKECEYLTCAHHCFSELRLPVRLPH